MNMYSRVLLVLFGGRFFFFWGYGVLSWVNPELPAEYAGLFIATHDGYAEMTSVYGGLQSGFGAILIASGFLKPYERAGLWLILICVGAIAVARGSVALGDLDSSFQVANSSLGYRHELEASLPTLGVLWLSRLLSRSGRVSPC